MGKIKNIIFDLGAVLFDIDFQKVNQAFADLGVQNIEQQYSKLSANFLFENLEMGKITTDEFYQTLQAQTDVPLSQQQLENAWNAILLNFRKESMAFVTQLKQTHRVFLLSNTNIIHLKQINFQAKTELDVERLDDFFEKVYYSFEMGMRKPDEHIFHYVLKDAQLLPEETFFIDDSAPNIETAAKIGFKTHLLLSDEKVETLTGYHD